MTVAGVPTPAYAIEEIIGLKPLPFRATTGLLQKVIRQTERTGETTVQRWVKRSAHTSLPRPAEREEILRRLGGNIRRERTLRTISQGKLAQLAGINRRTVAKIEAGELHVKIETLARISRAIGCPLATLRNGIDGETENGADCGRRLRTSEPGRFPWRNKQAKRSILFCLVLAASTVARANDTYRIDPGRSMIGFGVHQFLGVTKGKFNQFAGTIEIDREHPERSSVEARIQLKSIDTGIRKRDEDLCSAEFFNAEKFPQIIFKSRRVKQTGPQTGDIAGDLTMHGVTRPVTLHVKLITPLDGQKAMQRSRWKVTTDPIKRRDFNLMFGRTLEAISGIGQEVSVEITIEAIRTH
jgi:polyisoprenoid-binding protein YceI/ribosome-binding protein aMBF1 (putative translation factor)